MIKTPEQFSKEIVAICNEKSLTYIDAVLYWCEQTNHEVEYAASLIKNDPKIFSNIEIEAENLNVIKKTSRLPV
jgi:hypothetical protein